MKRIALAVVISLFAVGTASAASCKKDAADKKLSGAAMTSFMKKCKADAKESCKKSAMEKKLSGAAETSFEKKCVQDAVSG